MFVKFLAFQTMLYFDYILSVFLFALKKIGALKIYDVYFSMKHNNVIFFIY